MKGKNKKDQSKMLKKTILYAVVLLVIIESVHFLFLSGGLAQILEGMNLAMPLNNSYARASDIIVLKKAIVYVRHNVTGCCDSKLSFIY